MRPFFLFLITTTLLLSACKNEPSAEELAIGAAKEAAEKSYTAFLDNRYDEYLSHRSGSDSLPESYRQQLIEAYQQFKALQEKEHGSICSFRVSNARMDSTMNLVQVFLVLNYADSVQEEIVVPMIEENGSWKMK